jgi:hypothetical protein
MWVRAEIRPCISWMREHFASPFFIGTARMAATYREHYFGHDEVSYFMYFCLSSE